MMRVMTALAAALAPTPISRAAVRLGAPAMRISFNSTEPVPLPPPEDLTTTLLISVGGTAAATAAGACAGYALTQALGTPNALIDGAIGAVNIGGGGLLGLWLGVLWAAERAARGAADRAVRQAVGRMASAREDERAGTRALESVRRVVGTLRALDGIEGLFVGVALSVLGLYDEAGLLRLAEAAEESGGGARAGAADGPKSLSDVLSFVLEESIAGRFNALRFGTCGVAAIALALVDGGVVAVERGLGM